MKRCVRAVFNIGMKMEVSNEISDGSFNMHTRVYIASRFGGDRKASKFSPIQNSQQYSDRVHIYL